LRRTDIWSHSCRSCWRQSSRISSR